MLEVGKGLREDRRKMKDTGLVISKTYDESWSAAKHKETDLPNYLSHFVSDKQEDK